MKENALSEQAKSYLLRLASGERLDWYPELGRLGYRLNGCAVLPGAAISELRLANLVGWTAQEGYPRRFALSEEGMILAGALRSTTSRTLEMEQEPSELLERNSILRETSESLAEETRRLIEKSRMLLHRSQKIRSAIRSNLPKKPE